MEASPAERRFSPARCAVILAPLPAVAGLSFTAPRGAAAGECPMQNAVILINAEKGQVKAVAERLADVEGISEVYSTCGRYDLVAIARTRDFESLAERSEERRVGKEWRCRWWGGW